MKIKTFALLFMLLINCCVAAQEVRYCPRCSAEAYSKLAMSCEYCNASLAEENKTKKNVEFASLHVKLMYTGDKPGDLYPYAKMYVNGKYQGNVEIADMQQRNSEIKQEWNNGLGGLCTCIYEKHFEKVTQGVKKIEFELRFKRLGGLLKSTKRVVFPYVSFKPGERTLIEHYFNSAVSFTQHKTPEELGLKNPLLKNFPEAELKTATGTAEISVGL
ncbi:hypothetical protein EOM81_00830 [bacterium]|nr:hypothetical protein [bacterium]